MPLVVRLRSAVCLLGRFPALAGVDLDVAAGEVVLLSGANGSGKTTLLRLLAGLHRLHSGSGVVLGHDLSTDRRGARRAISVLGHETGCYDDLTVGENLRFAVRAAGRAAAASDPVLDRIGLTAQADVAHGRLSAGQRRRLALGIALARDPRLLLLDEPHAGLDAAGRAVLDAVVAAAPDEDRTVILASHELDRARALAGREVVLAGGVARGAHDFGVAESRRAELSDAKTEKEPVTP
ncbi:MAG TPA: heme ABC exporter ATP-binding protein CcmA [Acidimicrobiia bacterium]|nr:heme ABC exporter ATP-binding protein CcmA [Acidimicrobiia bacterium]